MLWSQPTAAACGAHAYETSTHLELLPRFVVSLLCCVHLALHLLQLLTQLLHLALHIKRLSTPLQQSTSLCCLPAFECCNCNCTASIPPGTLTV